MNKGGFYLIFFGFIVLIAVITNPDQERHKEVISAKINLHVQKSLTQDLKQNNNSNELSGSDLTNMLSSAIISKLVASLITVDNYVLFSTTKITYQGESRVIGIGVFGNVVLTKKLSESLIDELMENN